MSSDRIDKLLEKFWEGETSVEEERILKQHFAARKNIDSSKTDEEYFSHISEFQGINIDPVYKVLSIPIHMIQPSKKEKRTGLIRIIGIAAVLMVTIIGVKLSFDQIRLKKEEESIELVREAEKDLVKIANSLNEGYQDPNISIIEKQ